MLLTLRFVKHQALKRQLHFNLYNLSWDCPRKILKSNSSMVSEFERIVDFKLSYYWKIDVTTFLTSTGIATVNR